jgi:hypothetical protein
MEYRNNIRVRRNRHGGLTFEHRNGTRLYWPNLNAPLYLLGLRTPVQVTEPVANPAAARAAAIAALAI